VQRIDSVVRLLNATGLGLCVKLSCLRRFSACSRRSPLSENDRVIRFGKRKARLCTARLGSSLQHEPGRSDISLGDQRSGAGHQSCRFKGIFYSRGRRLRHSLRRDLIDRFALSNRGAICHRACSRRQPLRGFRITGHCSRRVALLFELRCDSLRGLPELLRFLTGLAGQCNFRFEAAARAGKFAGQGSDSVAFLR
jgi:hypothetical protein